MRRLLFLTLALAATTSVAAAATIKSFDLPTVLKSQIAKLHAKGVGPVLLPQKYQTDVKHLYPSLVAAGSGGWDIEIGAVKGCGEATACFEASLTARKGAPDNTIAVKLTGGVTGYYRDLSCGGSCSPASIEFQQSGFTYEYQANVVGHKAQSTKSLLIAMADSALKHGAR